MHDRLKPRRSKRSYFHFVNGPGVGDLELRRCFRRCTAAHGGRYAGRHARNAETRRGVTERRALARGERYPGRRQKEPWRRRSSAQAVDRLRAYACLKSATRGRSRGNESETSTPGKVLAARMRHEGRQKKRRNRIAQAPEARRPWRRAFPACMRAQAHRA